MRKPLYGSEKLKKRKTSRQTNGEIKLLWREYRERQVLLHDTGVQLPVQVKGGSLAQGDLLLATILGSIRRKNGVFNPKHNDRSFDVSHSEHINEKRATHNIYWDCYNGYRQLAEKDSDEIEMASTFEEVEQLYYHNRYSDYTDGQNERNAKSRHTERNRTTDEILKNKKTCPEETLLQIGKMEEHVSAETLFLIATEFFAEFEQRFGSHVHILDWALHIDEKTPHIHERHVFDCENQYGELCPQQEKALEALGFELPEPDKKPGRYNNRKMIFDATCRTLLFEICKKHGLHLDEEPEYGRRKHLEKQDFILAKQKEELTKQSSQIQS